MFIVTVSAMETGLPTQDSAESFTTIVRERNVFAVLNVLTQGGSLSRLDLARETGLSKPTVSAALRVLAQGGIVRPIGYATGSRGPRAGLYTVNPKSVLVLGLAIGSHFLRATVADLQGKPRQEEDIPLEAPDLDHLLQAMSTLKDRLDPSQGTIRLAVAGVPGVVDTATGTVRNVPNIAGLEGRGIGHLLSERLEIPTLVENDVNLAAIGEREFGREPVGDSYAYLLVGSGVGAGIVLNGELHRGARGAAGEVAFLPLGDDPFATTGRPQSGAMESRLSGDAIIAYAQVLAETTATELTEPYTTSQLFDAALRGDPLAKAVTDHAAREIALCIASLVAVIDVGLVLVGGGVGSRSDFLLGAVREYLSQLLPWPPTVMIASLGQSSVRLGAVALALESAVPATVRELVAADSEFGARG